LECFGGRESGRLESRIEAGHCADQDCRPRASPGREGGRRRLVAGDEGGADGARVGIVSSDRFCIPAVS